MILFFSLGEPIRGTTGVRWGQEAGTPAQMRHTIERARLLEQWAIEGQGAQGG